MKNNQTLAVIKRAGILVKNGKVRLEDVPMVKLALAKAKNVKKSKVKIKADDDVNSYQWFLLREDGSLHSGWEYQPDAKDALKEYREETGTKQGKIVHRRTIGKQELDKLLKSQSEKFSGTKNKAHKKVVNKKSKASVLEASSSRGTVDASMVDDFNGLWARFEGRYPKVAKNILKGDMADRFFGGLNSVSRMSVGGQEFLFIDTPQHGWIADMSGNVVGNEDDGFDDSRMNAELSRAFKEKVKVFGNSNLADAPHAVAANRTLIRDVSLKDGTTFSKGSPASVKFLSEEASKQGRICEVEVDGRTFTTLVTKLPVTLSGFKKPSEQTLEKWVNDGVCKTPTGQTVEPDGYGSDRSPSWLLAMGLI